ncbi:TIGR00374 family protein [Streptomyces maremycinicus]|uniref:TIGR00374 family protein n=1 Tax=Streptomyces maremycinicus TaxID=1679753 RepID=UPI00078771D8|nr:TIGR00374 family protein [Streptomyces sp. NBRC 110468]
MSQRPDPAAVSSRPEPRQTPARPGWGWWVGAAVVVVAALLVAVAHRHELAAASRLITQVQVPKLAVAVAFEAASLICFAAVQRWLLHAGGVRLSLRGMTALAVAANAVAGALPAGAAFSAAWLFRQLRRRGAGQLLAAAVLVTAGALAALSLFLLLLLGALTAGLSGAGTVLWPIGAVALLLGLGLAGLALSRIPRCREAVWRAWTSAGERSRRVRRIEEALVRLVGQARSVQPGLRPWLRPFSLALLNWTLDAACLAASLWALGIGVPWHGLLLAYGLTQIPGSLRLTPGSIGIVETSLAALLVLYGLSPEQAIAGTLLYRISSYWVLQPIGWASWIALTLHAGQSPKGPTDETAEASHPAP